MTVERFWVEGPDWELIRGDDGELVRWEDYSRVVKENEQIWETFVKVSDRLGINPIEAMKAPGKPSDVFIAKINELEREDD